MNEKFSTLFLDSIKDGSYTIGLKNKISEVRRLVRDAQENKIDELRFSSHKDESQSETIRKNPTELTNNFLTDSNISQSYKNPSYYPPVPKYKIPK
jgi:hypothetical protein